MAHVLCTSCGEETLDQLASCPSCNQPLSDDEKSSKAEHARQVTSGFAFVGGLGVATLCNMMGYTAFATAFGMIGLISMAVFIHGLHHSSHN